MGRRVLKWHIWFKDASRSGCVNNFDESRVWEDVIHAKADEI